MGVKFRNRIIAFFTFLGGIYFFLEYLLPEKIGSFQFGAYDDQILRGVQVVGIMSLGLGLINIFMVYGRNVIQRRKGWANSMALIVGFLLMFGILVGDMVVNERSLTERQSLDLLAKFTHQLSEDAKVGKPIADSRLIALKGELQRRLVEQEKIGTSQRSAEDTTTVAELSLAVESLSQSGEPWREETLADQLSAIEGKLAPFIALAGAQATKRYETSVAKTASEFFYQAFFVPLSSAIFSLLAFYIATAAYRAFRIKSFESTVMMAAALLVILGQIPHGPMYIASDLPAIRLWLLENISTPSFRAIYFGSTVAGLAMAIRMWLSLERGQQDADS